MTARGLWVTSQALKGKREISLSMLDTDSGNVAAFTVAQTKLQYME